MYKKDTNFSSPEIGNIKAARRGRESYGDSTIGYVQPKKSVDEWIEIAVVSQEDSVNNRSYKLIEILSRT